MALHLHPLPAQVDDLLRLALAEDIGTGDLTTTACVPHDTTATGRLLAKEVLVLAGLPFFRRVFELVDPTVEVVAHFADGALIPPGTIVAELAGPARSLLIGERTALNVLQRLCGTATVTRRWVEAVAGTGAVIRDTRKTVPGLRAAQKYAVRCGGGQNHRMGLGDQALIKDNHVVAAGGVVPALRAVRALRPDIACEVECTLPEQVERACADGATLVLLDNMTLEATRESVAIARRFGTRTESSGGLRLDNAAEVASTGVDYLAVGALTHSAPTLDIALDLR